ncbi:MAG: hypothetical protein QM784_20895 [Polyangiaceae bacterium]
MSAKSKWPWICFSLVLGCSSTGVGNPGVAMQSLVVTSDPEVEPTVADTEEQLDAAQLQRAILVLGEIRLLGCDAPEKNTVVLSGPFIVDLAQNRMQPTLPDFELPETGLCGIDAVLAPANASAEMSGRSLFFRGTRSDGAIFLLFADMEGTLRIRPRAGVDWGDIEDYGLLWTMRPRRWLLPSELDTSEPDSTEGDRRIIAIDLDRHPVLYEAIRSRLGSRSTLHLDWDDDGRLDDAERKGDAWIGVGLDTLD